MIAISPCFFIPLCRIHPASVLAIKNYRPILSCPNPPLPRPLHPPSTIKDSLDQDHSVEEQLVECIDHALTPKDKGQPQTQSQTQGQGLERKQGHSEGRGDRVGSDMQAVTNRNSLSGGSGSSSDHDGSSSSLSSPSASGSSSGKLCMHASIMQHINQWVKNYLDCILLNLTRPLNGLLPLTITLIYPPICQSSSSRSFII